MTQHAEQELLAKIKKGNQAALGMLLKSQQQRLYNICLRMVGNRDDAAEVTQDALLKIIQNISRFRGDAQLSTWMVRITMNQAISHLRKRKHRQTVSLDAQMAGHRDDQAVSLRQQLADPREPGPATSVETQEMLDQLQIALGQIDDEHRAVLVLRDIDQLDYKAIAKALELPTGTVKSRLYRARLALRHEMLKLNPPPTDEVPS